MTECNNVNSPNDPSITREQHQDDEPNPSLGTKHPHHPPHPADIRVSCSTADMTASLSSVEDLLEELHKWLILQGSRSQGVKPFLAAYFHKLRAMEIPVDLIFGGGVLLSEYTPGYIWMCESSDGDMVEEVDSVCAEIEISREHFQVYTASLEADDPFVRLRLGAPSVRLLAGRDAIPEKSCVWYHQKNLTDYFALPILYRGTFRGGFAWATRTAGGFGDDYLQFFEKAMPAFSAVMRLQTNDLIMESLTVRVEAEISERTTSLQIANQELEQANNRILQQAAAQLEHFACMSHEVRTPLNCILGMSNLLLDDEAPLTPSQKDMIQLITTSGNLLRAVVDDVLDYTKLAAGHIDIQIKPCNLQEILFSSVRAFEGQCQAHKLTLRPQIGPIVPEVIESDPRRLSQILYNLIGNAVKFSKEGGTIDIAVSLEDNEEKKQVLKLVIKDYGKGIDKKHLEQIFQPFYQTDTGTAESTYGGTGLGLSIASKIVHGLGGTITADSEVGKWCQFTVELPCTSSSLSVDTTQLQTVLQNVVVALILPDSERERLTRDVLAPFGVNAEVLRSCGDLHELGQHCSARSYVVLCDHTLYDQEKVESFTRWEGERRVTIITCGAASKVTGHADAHFEFLSLVFPSVLMQKICEILQSKLSGIFKTNPPAVSLIEGESIATSQQHTGQAPEKTAAISTPQQPAVQEAKRSPMSSPQQQPAVQEAKKTTLSLPKPTNQEAKEDTNAETPYSTLKVLITEDNLINQKVLQKVLSRLGLENVDTVDNGAKAVALTAEKPFDLIFMDIQM